MSLISAYVRTLDGELRLPRRLRARIVTEVAGHLDEARAALTAAGVEGREAERRAIDEFGDARDLAQHFGAQVAAFAGRRATQSAGAALLGFMALFGALSALPARSVGWLDVFPFGLVLFVLAQVAVVAGVLSVVRVLRHPRGAVIDATRLRYVLRGNVVVLACVALAAAGGIVAALGHVHPGRVAIDGLAMTGLALLGTLTSWAAARTLRAARVVRAAPAAPVAGELAVDDLQAAARRLRAGLETRAPGLAVRAASAERRLMAADGAVVRRAAFITPWLDLRRHPWRFCVTVAALVGCGLSAQHGLADGGLDVSVSIGEIARMLAGGVILASIEAAFVIAGFALLGGWLGIRPAVGFTSARGGAP